ncbi:EamA family transporter [Candidatus Woesearchaeota archaeon]|nr:EamA family transporter [Candidatus Woesearchaeota archaeon]
MLGIILAILTAFFASIKDVFSKKGLKNIDEYTVSFSVMFFALPFVVPLLFFTGIPVVGDSFWEALFLGGTLNILAIVLYMKAIKSSDLSITIPMIAFTPLFLLLTSPLMVGEFPNAVGLIGVLIIVLGSYVLNIKKRKDGFLAPFKSLLKEKGPRLMLMVAFIWSITSNFDKIGVQNSSPIFWIVLKGLFTSLVLFFLVLYKSKRRSKQILTDWKVLVPIGLFSGISLIFQMTAINLTLVAYVISIKRVSVVLSVFWGYFIFKEKGIKERLLGSVIMVLGVILIVLS